MERDVGHLSPTFLVALWPTEDTWWIIALGAILLLAVIAVFHYQFLVRLPLWVLRHTLYRVHIHGAENIPKTGPALLVSNHVSHIDALLVLAAQKRQIRFLIWAPFLGVPFLRWALRLAKVIPVNSAAGPRAIVQSLRTAGEALARGEVVCIFAEGGISRTGFLLPFQRGFEQIVKRAPAGGQGAPIIPVCLDHVWGSIFSYQGKRFFWKLPRHIPYRVYVSFGAALPATASAFEVRQAIQRLSAASAIRRSGRRRPVHRQFVRMAASHPFRTAIVDANAAKPVMRYGEVLAAAKILTKRLRPLLGDEAMVGVWLPPGLAGALANIGVTFLGKTAVNLNYSATADIVRSAIRQCGIRHILTSRLFTHKVPLDPGPGVEFINLEDFRKSISKWERLRAMASVLLVPRFIQERWLLGLGKHTVEQLATVIFSSGSTGEPKGVMLTHSNIAANAESIIQAVDPVPADRLLGVLPFFHSFGYTVTLWVPLQIGTSTIYHANPLQAREIGELCRKHQCTIFLSTPTFLRSFLKRCAPGDFSSVRILLGGAEKMPLALMDEFKAKFGVTVLEGYGCTELSPAAIVNVPDWQQGSMRQLGNKPGTIGQPIPGVAARIVRSQEAGIRRQEAGGRSQEAGIRRQEAGGRSQEAGIRSQEAGIRSQEAGGRGQETGVRRQGAGDIGQKSLTPDSCPLTPDSCPLTPDSSSLVDVPVGEEGLLIVYGANVMKGYLGNEELTRKKVVNGWYITGDLAKMDEDGFVAITGREERFAKVGGEMVPLEKVEEELHGVLGTSERLAVVTAIADAKRGERIVVLHLPLEVSPGEVVKGLGERGLPNIYLPGPRDFFEVKELPILGSGKLDLKKCNLMAQELAGGKVGEGGMKDEG
jgi:acyl-[acyl-carrier-protein]-phospholipid O-acyltransferase/long-chain-fatty-acid--[acyl-carrier-protein] ligase